MIKLLHVLLLLCLTATGAYAQTGTAKNKPALNTETTTNFPDNTTGLITPAVTRQSLVDYIASWEQAASVRAVTGTTDTLLNTDTGQLVTYSNVGAIAVTLPQATGNFLVWDATLCNKNTGLVTITPTTSTINGAATLTLPVNTCTRIVSDGTNYQITFPTNVVGNNGVTCPYSAPTYTCGLTAGRQTLPTVSVATTGSHSGGMSANASGTYTTPANVLWIEITLVGAGGGGSSGNGSSGSAGTDTCWNTSGAACSTPVYDAGGGGAGLNTGSPAVGGAISGSGTCTTPMPGAGMDSIRPSNGTQAASSGANSTLGGAGGGGFSSTIAGQAAAANSGSGGGGGGGNAATTGAGGAAGATCYVIINTPAATYTYAVGALGTGNTSPGAGGTNGGNGGGGYIRVIEHYGS